MSMSASNGLRSVKNRMLHRKLSANRRYHRSYDCMPFGRAGREYQSGRYADVIVVKVPHYGGKNDCESRRFDCWDTICSKSAR